MTRFRRIALTVELVSIGLFAGLAGCTQNAELSLGHGSSLKTKPADQTQVGETTAEPKPNPRAAQRQPRPPRSGSLETKPSVGVVDLDQQIDDFRATLQTDQFAEAGSRLKQILDTPTGKLVLIDRANRAEQKLREEAQSQIVARFFDDYFEHVNGGYRARQTHQERLNALLRQKAIYDRDLKIVKEVIKPYADRMLSDGELNERIYDELHCEWGIHRIYSWELTRDLGYRPGPTSDVRPYIERYLDQYLLAPTADGRFAAVEGEYTFRVSKMHRRAYDTNAVELRIIDLFAKRVEDRELRAALRSYLGSDLFLIRFANDTFAKDSGIRSLYRPLADNRSKQFDGFSHWADQHFEKSERGYVVVKRSLNELRGVLNQAQEVLDNLSQGRL